MQKPFENLCVRCGKPRIHVKTWQDKIGLSHVTYTTTACPDTECQKIVDKQNTERENKRQLHLKNRSDAKLSKHKQLVLR